MRKLFAGLLFLAASQTVAAQNGTFSLKADLKGLGDSLIVFVPNGSGYHRDTVLVKGNRFEYTTKLSKPVDIALYTPKTLRQEDNKGFNFIAVPGEKAELKGDVAVRYDVTGSKFYQQYHEMDVVMEAAMQPMIDLNKELDAMVAKGTSEDAVMKIYNSKMPALQAAFGKTLMEFIEKHPDYEASATLVPQLGELDQMEKGAALLSAAVKNGRMKDYYEGYIQQARAQQEADAASQKAQAAGVDAPDFTLNDINGKPLALKSLRGKYVVLDFWGSWCIWCIKGMPQMKEYYNKYQGKFEILGVDCNDTEAKWKAAVEKNKLPWLHVYNPKSSSVLRDYAIQGFPTKIIIGPDGKIVKTFVGEDPAFYQELDQLFK